MKKTFSHFGLIFALVIMVLSACGPSQKITNSWISPDAAKNAPYDSIFVIVLSQDKETSYSVEDQLAGVIASRGQRFVLSSSVFPPNLRISDNFSKEQMAQAIRKTGCKAVFMVALIDVQTVETYHPGVSFSPYGYGYYSSYYGYYNHYYPQIYSPGYYSSNRTYTIETNFYDLEEDRHLWLIQSEASNPASLESWFDTYIRQLMEELENEGLIRH